ncbi:hypothetical protein Tco_0490286 [Tanacetum coccineum]
MDDDSEDETDDDMGYDPSDVAFIEWLGSKIFNYKTMDQYTMKALWIYWIRGDDEVELTDEESYDNEDEIVEVFRIDTNVFDYETPICSAFNEFNYLLKVDPDLLTKDIIGFKTYEDYKDDWIYEWNKDVPWVDEKPWTNVGVWTESKLVIHTCKPFNYKIGCSEWPTCSWVDDGYYNRGNLPGTYIIGNQLHYQDLEWYEALEDSKLKEEALRNKAIMDGFVNDDDDESRCELKRRWNIYTNYGDAYEINHEDNESKELCEVHEPPLPSKEKDPGSFTIPYDIGQLHIDNALADLGASISLMPYTMYKKLGLGEPMATRMNFFILDMPKDSRVPIILGRPFLVTARAMIDVPTTEDDEYYGIDDLDETINKEAQEVLTNKEPGSFLSRGRKKSINQSDLECCEPTSSNEKNGSDSENSIRRINSVNTPYPVTYGTTNGDNVKCEHLYSGSANEIDEKKPELKNLPQHL